MLSAFPTVRRLATPSEGCARRLARQLQHTITMRLNKGAFLWILLVLGGLALVGAGCARDPERLRQYYFERGTRFLSEGKLNEAVIELRNALRFDQRDPRALRALGQAYLGKAWYADAARELRRAVEVDPASTPTRLLLARSYLALEFWPEARAQGELIQEREPGNPHASFVIGTAAAGTGDLKTGVPLLREAVGRAPEAAEIHQALGDALTRQGDIQAARRSYDAALALRPDNVDALLGIGALLLLERRLEEAENMLLRARGLQPDSASVRLAMYTLRAIQDRDAEALAELEALPEAGWSPRFELVLGETYVRTGRYGRAAEVLGRLVRQFPTLTPARYWFGYASLGENKPERAVEAFQRVASEMPQHPATHYGLASAYIHAGKPREALAELGQVARALERTPDYHLQRARALRLLDRLDEAQRAAETARQMAPGEHDAYAVLGQIFAARKNLAKATEMYGKAIELQPKDPGLHLTLGQLLTLQNRPADALRAFDRAVEQNPRHEPSVNAKVAVLVEQGRIDEALALVADLAKRDPTQPQWPTLTGGLHSRRGDAARAEAEYRRALKLSEQHVPARFNLARVLLSQRKEAEAMPHLQHILDKDPGHVAAS